MGDISGDLLPDIRRFIGRYFKYRPAASDMGERFPHILSTIDKKWDICWYLGRYLKQGLQAMFSSFAWGTF